jgi:hypothetical protein
MTESGGFHVLQMNDSDIQLTFLHAKNLSKSVTYSSSPDILRVLASKVLTKVDPDTARGCTYVNRGKESYYTTEKLETTLCRP